MSSENSKTSSMESKHCILGEDFDVLKRNTVESIFGNKKNVFKYESDRFLSSRAQTRADFLDKSSIEHFNITLPDNNWRTMKKIQYQNQLRLMFNSQKEHECHRREATKKDDKKDETADKSSILHLDWSCKLENIREKFLPDFETLEKANFPNIHTYIWSSNQIIAASSNRKICLYHPLNGFTRALDITGRVALAFSTSGDRLAMAYRKSKRAPNEYELFLFKMQHTALFKSEKLDTEKVKTEITDDITAMCFTKNDTFLMCGSASGKIYALEPMHDAEKNTNRWVIFKVLNESHKHEVFKICFSATYQYMATIDTKGEFKIWNGGSFTLIFSFLKEESRMYRHFEWHPYVENEFIFGRIFYPALFLFNVTERKIVAGFMNWKDEWELSSIAFNPINGQLAVCFYNEDEFINRVAILGSMSQVICTFDFDYIEGGLKLFWNKTGTMLGAGAASFRFAFWSFLKNRDFHMQMANCFISTKKNAKEILTLADSKLNCIR